MEMPGVPAAEMAFSRLEACLGLLEAQSLQCCLWIYYCSLV